MHEQLKLRFRQKFTVIDIDKFEDWYKDLPDEEKESVRTLA